MNNTNNADAALDPDTYLQHAQIIQGVLIFLSACVAVVGYAVQARLQARERARELESQHTQHLRKLRLERTRLQISDFVGPAMQLSMNLTSILMGHFTPKDMLAGSGMMGCTVPVRSNFYDLGGDAMQRHSKVHKGAWDTGQIVQGNSTMLNSFVGFELEKQMSKDPQGDVAQCYMRLIKRSIQLYARPLATLILRHAQSLQERPSLKKFKEEHPEAGRSPMARNLFYITYVDWVNSFDKITQDWDQGNFRLMFPPDALCPVLQLNSYLVSQLTELRDKEEALGGMDHNTTKNETSKNFNGKAQFDKLAKSMEPNSSKASAYKVAGAGP